MKLYVVALGVALVVGLFGACAASDAWVSSADCRAWEQGRFRGFDADRQCAERLHRQRVLDSI